MGTLKEKAVAVDMWINGHILWGDPDETISGRMGRHLPTCWVCRTLCKVLNYVLGRDHCVNAIDPEEMNNP